MLRVIFAGCLSSSQSPVESVKTSLMKSQATCAVLNKRRLLIFNLIIFCGNKNVLVLR